MKIMKRRMKGVLKGPWSVQIPKSAPCLGREHKKKVATDNEHHRISNKYPPRITLWAPFGGLRGPKSESLKAKCLEPFLKNVHPT